MRVIQVYKTSDGALWGFNQVKKLKSLGIEVIVVLPKKSGAMIEKWKSLDIEIIFEDFSLPIKYPHLFFQRRKKIQEIIEAYSPDIVHSHFFTNALMLRYSRSSKLKQKGIPYIFQVPGPLHLENSFFKLWELSSAGDQDYWIASSQYIKNLYLTNKVSAKKVFLSYYGNDYSSFGDQRTNALRDKLGIPRDCFMVGNINFMYPPKFYLGQKTGLKSHETIIKAFAKVIKEQSIPNFIGVLIGGQFPQSGKYEEKLKNLAKSIDPERIILPGRVKFDDAGPIWPDFDLAVHTPLSENCGGVLEPLLSKVPTIGSKTGGIPELIISNSTGILIPNNKPEIIATAILQAFQDHQKHKQEAFTGQKLASKMFDINRTAEEIYQIYRHLSNGSQAPQDFCSRRFLNLDS